LIARDIYRDPIEYRDPFEPSIEEKIFLGAKRLCVAFAGCALILGALDIVGIRSFDGAGEFLNSARGQIAAFGDTARTGLQNIALTPSSESVLVQIPKSPPAKPALAKSAPSPVSELAAVRDQDAVTIAMAPPPVLAKRGPAPAISAPASNLAAIKEPDFNSAPKFDDIAPRTKPAAAPPDRIRSASAETGALSLPTLVSLPMSGPDMAIPLERVPLPRPAPGVPPPSPAERLGLKGKEYAKAERCLANAIYFEARSEPVRGQMAVAQVVVNRAFSGFYPNDICSVVYQNAHRHLACQFTFACDGKRKAINDRGAWARANRIARQTLDGQLYVPEVAKSTHYHAVYVHPYWVREMRKMVRYGVHAFYRPYAWGNGAENPIWGSAAMASAKKSDAK
jgi:hypothetical protein